MWQAFVLTFRGGLEAFVAAAVVLVWCRRVGPEPLARRARAGAALSIPASLLAGWQYAVTAHQALWEGVFAALATIAVAAFAWQWQASWRDWLRDPGAARPPRDAGRAATPSHQLVVILLMLVVVTREGMEMTLLVGTLLWQVQSPALLGGAAAGIVAALVVAWLWSRTAPRLSYRAVAAATGGFLFSLVVLLSIAGVHELSEARVLPGSEALHAATEPYGPEGRYGQHLSYVPAAAAFVGVLVALFLGHGKTSDTGVAHVDQ